MNKNIIIGTVVMLGTIAAGYYYFNHYIPGKKEQLAKERQKISRELMIEQKKFDQNKKFSLKNFKKSKDNSIVIKKNRITTSSKKLPGKVQKDLDALKRIDFEKVNYGKFFDYLKNDNSITYVKITKSKRNKKDKNYNADISFLENTKYLEHLEVDSLSSIDSLSSLKKAKEIKLINLNTKTLDPLKSLKSVENLEISSKTLTDISALNSIEKGTVFLDINLKKLKKTLSGDSHLCKEFNIYVKQDKKEAKKLQRKFGPSFKPFDRKRVVIDDYDKFCGKSEKIVFDGKVKRPSRENKGVFDGIRERKAVEVLDIQSAHLSEIKTMEKFILLKDLTINANRLSSLNFLDTIIGLEKLTLKNMTINKSIRERLKLKNLKELTLINVTNSENLLSFVSMSNKMESLKIIESDLEKLDIEMKNLNRLELLSNKKLYSLENLKNNPSIKSLKVEDSNIRTLEGLASLKNLESLHLKNNDNLADVRAIEKLNIRDITIDNKYLAFKLTKDSSLCKEKKTYCK